MSKSPRTSEAALRRLEWTVLKKLDGALHGDYRTLFRGVGLDLAGLREYQHHDDVRHIDWNVTARTQVAHVREHQEDREVTAWFLLDLRRRANAPRPLLAGAPTSEDESWLDAEIAASEDDPEEGER